MKKEKETHLGSGAQKEKYHFQTKILNQLFFSIVTFKFVPRKKCRWEKKYRRKNTDSHGVEMD